ncbi:MAG: hypothetical protein HZA35_02385 [Parcubacteria group bacterium]|nr:hypothetical protein [Parcubacteria group bacterium]
MEKEPLVFIIVPKGNTKAKDALKKLGEYATSLSICFTDTYVFRRVNMFTVALNKKDAEILFRAKFQWVTFTVPNLNTGPHEKSDWKVIKPPQIPQGLEDSIQSITLDQQVFLTD